MVSKLLPKLSLALLLCIIAISAIHASEVVQLDSSNFDEVIKSQPYTLVKFFAPWCGHCRTLAPLYVEAAEKLDGHAKIAEVDCTDNKELCRKYKVAGYPTLLGIDSEGVSVPYDDARSTEALVANVMAAITSPTTIITTEAELDTFKALPNSLKLLIRTKIGSELETKINEVAQKLRRVVTVGIIDSEKIGASTEPTQKITLLRTFDEPVVVLEAAEGIGEDKITTEMVTKFVNANSLPLIGEIGPHNFKKFLSRKMPLMWIFINPDDEYQVEMVEKTLKPLAKSVQEKLLFARLDGKKWAKHANSFGLTSSTPGIVIEDQESGKKFLFPFEKNDDSKEKFTLDTITAWVKKYQAGELTPDVKSEPIPTEEEKAQSAVTKIVGHTFEKIILESNKDILVKFYSPGCGHCKTMAKDYIELAEAYKNDENVIIAEIDATKNDLPVPIRGYPTLFFFPQGSTKETTPVEFNGERTVEEFKAFVERNRKSTPSTTKADKAEKEEL